MRTVGANHRTTGPRLSPYSAFSVIVSWSLLKASLILGLSFPTLVLGKTRSKYYLSLVILGGMFDGLRIASELSSPFNRVGITDESESCKILIIVWHIFIASSMGFQ